MIIAASWLVHRCAVRPPIDIGAHPVVRAGLALIGLACVSTVLSIDPRLSFFGSFDRGLGWLTLAAGGVLLITAADLFADESRRERAISLLLLGSLVPCGYMFVQRVGLDPVHWVARGAPGSTLGSPTFLGGYLVLVVPFALYRVVQCARQASLLIYAGWLAVLLVVCSVLLMTTIRGPLLGLVAGVLAFAGFAHGSSKRIGWSELATPAGLLLAVAAVAVAAAGAGGLQSLQRFISVGQAVDSSSQRLTIWQDALRAPFSNLGRVLVGYGAETQSIVLEHAEATVRRTPVELWDRAHNVFLDTWLTGGLLGVAALALVLGLTMKTALCAGESSPGKLVRAAVLAALVGHLVEVAFAFHTVVSESLFWFVLGLAASLTPRRGLTSTSPAGRRMVSALAVVVGVLLLPLMAAPAVADALYGAARRSDYAVGARLEEQAGAWTPWVEELPRAAALDWLQVANRRDDALAASRAEQDLLEAAARAPLLPTPLVRLTRLYLARGDLEAAERACQQAILAGPYRAPVWDACADVSTAGALTDEANLRRSRADAVRLPS